MVIATPGEDGHGRAAETVARALRDAGMEVVYAGRHQTPEQIVDTLVQEDADAVGLPVLPAEPAALLARLAELMRERGVDDDVVVFGGGEDTGMALPGLTRLFPPAAPVADIAGWLRERVGPGAVRR